MKTSSPFDHRPDPALGSALREILTPDDHRTFVNRVVRRAQLQFMTGMSPQTWVELLSAWARPGIAAALLLVAVGVAGHLKRAERPVQVTLEDTLSEVPQTVESTSFLVSTEPPDFDLILASGIDGRANR